MKCCNEGAAWILWNNENNVCSSFRETFTLCNTIWYPDCSWEIVTIGVLYLLSEVPLNLILRAQAFKVGLILFFSPQNTAIAMPIALSIKQFSSYCWGWMFKDETNTLTLLAFCSYLKLLLYFIFKAGWLNECMLTQSFLATAAWNAAKHSSKLVQAMQQQVSNFKL